MYVSSLVRRDSIDQSEMNIRQKQINLFIITHITSDFRRPKSKIQKYLYEMKKIS